MASGVCFETKYIRSVPFAKPPIGDLRFELPSKLESWKSVKNATEFGPSCLSPEDLIKKKRFHMSEDCLYLNIFTSENCLRSQKCHVLIYFHGGGMDSGSPNYFPDDFILQHYVKEDVIFVIPAFRLGVFGSYSFKDESIPKKNLALYDCIEAIKFVNREIKNFGGDSKNVHLIGHSMGGTIVAALGFSRFVDPHQKLFKRLLIFSMLPSFVMPELYSENVYNITKLVGCHMYFTDKRKTLDCMKNIDYKTLMRAQYQLLENHHYFLGLSRNPPIMLENETVEAFINKCPPREILIGVTKKENAFERWPKENPFVSGSFWNFHNPYEVAEYYDYLQYAPNSTIYEPDSESTFVGTWLYSKKMAERGGKVFLFQSDQEPGSSHMSDMQYFIGLNTENRTTDMQLLDSFYSRMLVNFTKYGEPSPNWKTLDPSKMNYFSVQVISTSDTWPTMKNNFQKECLNFWINNITVFDNFVSRTKHKIFKDETFELNPISDKWWTYLAIVGVSFLVAVILFFIRILIRRRGYISIE
ncbi:unnamed protein product [Caenorhabditis angaria]|uniref:Carboxylesterase type B domain-containing protein n=1 Tax=Caenorhabditis angaria TaxID=860376 RepID=A0A9P1N7V7_9PELO|nr:unnamed protein product [Caenorhabditis angaria]